MKQARRKTGNLSDGAKAPVKSHHGLDWPAIREARARRLDWQAALGVDDEETRLHTEGLSDRQEEARALAAVLKAAPKQAGITRAAQKKGGSRRAAPKVDVQLLVKLYQTDDMPPRDIAKRLGIHYDTAIRYLKKEGVWEPDKFRYGGPLNPAGPLVRPRNSYDTLPECHKGHDLTKPGAVKQLYKPDGKKNGRQCLQCLRERNRSSKQRNRPRVEDQ